MRYHSNVVSNLSNAAKAKDDKLFKDMILDELSTIIEENPYVLVKALRDSGETIGDEPTPKVLIDKTIKSIYNNKSFHLELAKAIKSQEILRKPARPEYSSVEGAVEGSSQGGSGTEVVSSIASMIGSVFTFASSNNELKASEQASKATLYGKILGDEGDSGKKTNWIPVVAIGGVLLIGGLIAWKVIGGKKA
jgi:hypothetical protein